MKFTIITVCYNSEKTIEKTLQSVLSQTEQDYEYLIIDGVSTDGTLELIQNYAPKFQGKLTLVSEPDKGIYDAMNKGIRLAKGELIGIVNSDDYYEPTALEVIWKAYEDTSAQSKYQILYGFERTLEDGQEASIVFHHHRNLLNQMITHPTCFVTKKLYQDKGTYNLDYRYSADYEFMLRMFHDEEVVFIPVYALISNYALGGASGSGEAYLETMGLLMKYGKVSKRKYWLLKSKVALSKWMHL